MQSKLKFVCEDGRFKITPVVKVEEDLEPIVISDDEDEVSQFDQESIVLSCDDSEGSEDPGVSNEGIPLVEQSPGSPDQFWLSSAELMQIQDSNEDQKLYEATIADTQELFDSDSDQWLIQIDDQGHSQVVRNSEFNTPQKRKRTQSNSLMEVLQQAPAKKQRKDKGQARGKQTKVRTQTRADKGKSRDKGKKQVNRKSNNFFITIAKTRKACTSRNNKYRVFKKLRSVDWIKSAVFFSRMGVG